MIENIHLSLYDFSVAQIRRKSSYVDAFSDSRMNARIVSSVNYARDHARLFGTLLDVCGRISQLRVANN